MFRSRLAVKIGLLIVAVLIIGFGASTIVTIQRESDALVEQNKIAARRLTATVVASAFAIHRRIAQLNEEYGGIFPSVQLHTGVNTGAALVGATKLGTGAGKRWTCTATGPTTNVAARFAGSAQDGEIVAGIYEKIA